MKQKRVVCPVPITLLLRHPITVKSVHGPQGAIGMNEFTDFAPGGALAVGGGALGWLLTWWRHSRKDVYIQVRESTQELINNQNNRIREQGDHISRLEGRLDQVTIQMTQTLNDAAATKIELGITRGKLEVAHTTIARLEQSNAEWQRRWDAQFPRELS